MLEHIDQIAILESSLLNRQLVRVEDGKIFNIERVYAEKWTLSGGEGWWINLLIEQDKSHTFVYWHNINCTYPVIVRQCDDSRSSYKLL